MRPFDPVEFFYSMIDRLVSFGRWLITPFLQLYGLLAAMLFSLVDRFMGRSAAQQEKDEGEDKQAGILQRAYGLFLEVVSLPKELVNKPQVGRVLESSLVERLARFFGAVFQISFFEPVRWMTSIAGASLSWLLSRDWARVLLATIPSVFLVVLIFMVWRGGRMDRLALAEMYLKLGKEELAALDRETISLSSDKGRSLDRAPDASSAFIGLAAMESNPVESKAIPRYCELLFQRVQLLQPQAQSSYVIGASLIQRGSIEQGRKLLRKIAPDDRRGHLESHAFLAASFLDEYRLTKNNDLLPIFLHHAEIAAKLPSTRIEVLIGASEVHLHNKDMAGAIELLEIAAKRSPVLYLQLAQLASQAGDQRLANSSLKNSMVFLRRVLASDPTNDKVRMQIVQLLGNSPEALLEAENLLKEGLDEKPSRLLSRALSEIYRIRFTRLLSANKGGEMILDFNLLEIGMQYDPTNPLIPELIMTLATDERLAQQDFKGTLNKVLTTGVATIIIHAALAEIHLHENQPNAALLHLEQMYRIEPLAIKYANLLAREYLNQDRPKDALDIAGRSVSLLEQIDMLKEKFGSDLIDALGQAHQQLDHPNEAIIVYEQCLQIDPKRADTRQRLAQLYRQTGQEANALLQEQAIAEISSSDENASVPKDSANQ